MATQQNRSVMYVGSEGNTYRRAFSEFFEDNSYRPGSVSDVPTLELAEGIARTRLGEFFREDADRYLIVNLVPFRLAQDDSDYLTTFRRVMQLARELDLSESSVVIHGEIPEAVTTQELRYLKAGYTNASELLDYFGRQDLSDHAAAVRSRVGSGATTGRIVQDGSSRSLDDRVGLGSDDWEIAASRTRFG